MEANITTVWPTNVSLLISSKMEIKVSDIMDIIQVFFYSVVFLIGSFGNGIVIWITARQASRTVNCVWFFHLAMADFLFSVTRIVPLIKNALYDGWPFGSFLCKANSFLKYLNMFCSVFLLADISLDRAASVAFPVWSKTRRGPRLAWMAAVGAWSAATATSLPFYVYRTTAIEKDNRTKCSLSLGDDKVAQLALYLLRFICGFLAPFTIIVICYGVIALKLTRRQATLRSKRPFKVILAIVITFFLCWAPYHLFLLLKLAGVKNKAVSVGLPLSSSLAYLNSCANPILYFFMGLDFRKKIGRLNLTGAFRKVLLEESGYYSRKPTKFRKEAASSTDGLELPKSMEIDQVI
ncbi:chemerin-like receptor 1 [Pogona vitticeps]